MAAQFDIEWLRETYFSDPDRQVVLEAGDYLLQPGQYNERLYLIREGTLVGFIENASGDRFEIFRSGEDNLVGAYSFFSIHHQTYSIVLAEERTVVAFVEHDDIDKTPGGYGEFARRILPIIVEEIYMRQLLAQRMSIENQETMRRLHQAEKLATLGQLAAGLAHELNNATGVILRKAEWLSDRISEYMREKDKPELYRFFERGLRRGHGLGSVEVRQRRNELEERFGLNSRMAKELAKIGVTDVEVSQNLNQIEQIAERVNYYYETGLALHDMLIAARHAGKVVQSVRELGAVTRSQPVPTQINQTIQEALSLLENILKNRIRLKLELADNLPPVTANPSDWVQVWVNIIKNAAEALEVAGTPSPQIAIRSARKKRAVSVAVTDNGPGIPPDVRERIFQPNFTTKKEGLSFGLGLGLSIVQKIVEIYQGTVEVDSRPGSTTFTITIPVF